MASLKPSKCEKDHRKGLPNSALHRTAIPLRSIAAGELCR